MNEYIEFFRPEEHNLVIVTGFGDKGVHELAGHLNESKPFCSTHVIPGVPWFRAYEHPETSSRRISAKIDSVPGGSKILIGDSLGALMALVYAARKELSGVLKLILIDGPLRDDVDVQPHKKLHHLFHRQYKGRRGLASIFQQKSRFLDLSRIVTMGTEEDRVVQPAAKRLDGVRHISLPYRGHSLRPKIVATLILENL